MSECCCGVSGGIISRHITYHSSIAYGLGIYGSGHPDVIIVVELRKQIATNAEKQTDWIRDVM